MTDLTTTRDDLEFAGKTALVTGAARGIGRASALAFAKRGANVVIADLLADDAATTVALIEQLGVGATFVETNVSDSADVQRAVAVALDTYGALHYAHNNAGTFAPAPLADLAEEDWHRTIAVNLTGVFFCLKYQIPPILASGGSIVNTASIWSMMASPAQGAYVASKHGVVGLTKQAATDYGPQGLRVNAVAPGPIATAMTAAVPADIMGPIVERSAQRRFGQPEEVGEAVAWLCSNGASYVNGAVLPVDGGWLTA